LSLAVKVGSFADPPKGIAFQVAPHGQTNKNHTKQKARGKNQGPQDIPKAMWYLQWNLSLWNKIFYLQQLNATRFGRTIWVLE
jgi:hypothetical protein